MKCPKCNEEVDVLEELDSFDDILLFLSKEEEKFRKTSSGSYDISIGNLLRHLSIAIFKTFGTKKPTIKLENLMDLILNWSFDCASNLEADKIKNLSEAIKEANEKGELC